LGWRSPPSERIPGHQHGGPLSDWRPSAPGGAGGPRVIDSEEALQVTDVVVAETGYVLTSIYQVSRSVVVDHF
jgi:hypothetical protein